MSQHEDVYDLAKEEREPFDENENYDPFYGPWDYGDDDWGDYEREKAREEERREIEKDLERLENEGGIGNQKA